MVTGRIRFLDRVVVIAEANGLGDHQPRAIYEAGDTYELPEPSCQRWLRRGLAVRVDAAQTPTLVTSDAPSCEATGASEAPGAGVAPEPEPEPAVVDDSAVVGRAHRRSDRRRTQPDPE